MLFGQHRVVDIKTESVLYQCIYEPVRERGYEKLCRLVGMVDTEIFQVLQ